MAQDTEKAWGEQGTTLLQEASWRGQGTIVRLMLGKSYRLRGSGFAGRGLGFGVEGVEGSVGVGAAGDVEFSKVRGDHKELLPFAVDIFFVCTRKLQQLLS